MHKLRFSYPMTRTFYYLSGRYGRKSHGGQNPPPPPTKNKLDLGKFIKDEPHCLKIIGKTQVFLIISGTNLFY